jgi:hypothetical protein
MKNELQKQMQSKEQYKKHSYQEENLKDKEYLAAVDKKLIDEEMKCIQHNHHLKVTVSAGKQYIINN